MENLNIQLLESIYKLLMRNGIKSMTMDDIARNLGLSKKTLYKSFKDKADLVYKVLENYLEEDKKALNSICLLKYNAIDEMYAITKHVGEQIKDIHPSIHFDLEKYYPQAWQIFINYKLNFIFSCVKANLEKGIEEQLYRENLNAAIIAKIHISRIEAIFDSNIFPVSEFRFTDVHNQVMRYHIRGIASEKGLKYMIKKYKNTNLDLI
ncbi:MAG TPA: TetR/AcrR family transcriptional regulator [Bacteroidia bacterium]|nr:TetR/AcrR family transcriptional regulator [Bacteroidia bacterium]